MFLNVTRRRNPKLIEAGAKLHQCGDIPPNTYIIDLDTIAQNVKRLASTAREYNFTLYFMSKQFGRIPELGTWIAQHGIQKAVAVEFEEARVLNQERIRIGNIGHLVQPGKHQWLEALKMKPEVVTVFSLERAKQVACAANKLGIIQPVLLRVFRPDDKIYPGQEGGFRLDELQSVIPEMMKISGITIAGVTSFPIMLMDEKTKDMMLTSNAETLLLAKSKLKEAGIQVNQINGPSATNCYTIPMLKKAGITHGEPGHAISGTTPIHAFKDLAEVPAAVYVTEVSHQDEENVYVIGGGFYERANLTGAYVGSDPKTISNHFLKGRKLSPEFIDYYGTLAGSDKKVTTGDTAIFAFRTQIFVTRANVALVKGIGSGRPEIVRFQRRG